MKCLCINDSNKPPEIPDDKWVEVGTEYNIIYVTFLQPQNVMAFQLLEIDLDGLPYEYFSYDRFIYKSDSYNELVDLIEFSANAINYIESLKGNVFDVCDMNENIVRENVDLEKAETLIEMLNDLGDNPPYYIKRKQLR
ncbi:MAG: hypothetical protein EBU66_15885 [Bacteroidetes bacterium]|nr:hypothetical protein [Bacteroidota bacterium]